jgi:hypothetical protein
MLVALLTLLSVMSQVLAQYSLQLQTLILFSNGV